MLSLSNVISGYGAAQALDSVSMSMADGGAVAILGRNGAGKSTLLKTIIGLLPVWEGQVTYRDTLLNDRSSDARAHMGIGYIPEDRRIFATLSVVENLTTGSKPGPGGEMPWTQDRVLDLFPELYRRRDAAAGTLSGGERQMLSIARALVGNPRLLLLDEPSEGLAPVILDRLVPTLRTLRNEGIGLLVAEQNRTLAERVTEHVLILETGKMVYSGTFEDLKAQPEFVTRHLGV